MGKKGLWRRMRMIVLVLMILVGVAGAALVFLSGAFQKPAYLEPWKKDYAQKFDDPRIRLAAHGLLAANGHNMQPWKIRLDPDDPMAFYLYADSDRLTDKVDPFARQMMVAQGTFLEYVGIAGDQSGYRTDLELFPEGGYEEQKLEESMNAVPVAKIKLTRAVPQNDPFYDEMFLPDTNRAPYRPDKLDAGQVGELEKLNTDEALSVRIFQDQGDIDRLGNYAVEAAAVEAGVDRVMKESEVIFRANESQKNRYRYGFSVEGQGTSGIMKHLMQGLVTLFPSLNNGRAASNLLIQSTKDAVAHTPAYAVILSKDNTRLSQVKSGMLYSRLILAARRQGLAMQPLSQALEEYPEMGELYRGIHRDYAPGGETIQMLVRLGRPTKEVPQSMRRDVMDLIAGE